MIVGAGGGVYLFCVTSSRSLSALAPEKLETCSIGKAGKGTGETSAGGELATAICLVTAGALLSAAYLRMQITRCQNGTTYSGEILVIRLKTASIGQMISLRYHTVLAEPPHVVLNIMNVNDFTL